MRFTDSWVTFCPVFSGMLKAMIHCINVEEKKKKKIGTTLAYAELGHVISQRCFETSWGLVLEWIYIPSVFGAGYNSNNSLDSNM